MKLIIENISDARTDLSALGTDIEDTTNLINKITDFIDGSVETLKGDGYDAIRNYMTGLYLPLLETRKDLAQNLEDASKNALDIMDNYLSENKYGLTEIDTNYVSELETEQNNINAAIENLRNMYKYDKNGNLIYDYGISKSIDNYQVQLYNLSLEIEFIKKLETVDATANSQLDDVSSAIEAYASAIGNITTLDKEIPTDVDGSDDGGGGTTPDGGTYTPSGSGGNPDGSSGGNAGSGSDVDGQGSGNTNVNGSTDDGTNKDGKDVAAAAVGLVGLTLTDLIKDTSSGVYGVSPYVEGQAWNVKFVNDILRRKSGNIDLLSEYYNSPEIYSDPYNSADDMIKYAMDPDSNMEFNWSNGSIDTIADYNKEHGYDEVTYKEYIPKEGDVIFLDSNTSDGTFVGNTSDVSSADRVGIVESVTEVKDADGNVKYNITVIEGDTGDNPSTSKVTRVTYSSDDKEILGYGTVKKYSTDTDTSNNHNGTQNGIVNDTDKNPDTDTPIDNKEEAKEVILEKNDYVERIDEDENTGGSVDYEGVQRDAEDNEIGKADISYNKDKEAIINIDEDIPSINTPVTPDSENNGQKIDMSDYDDGTGAVYDDLDPNMIVWDWENIDNDEDEKK